MGSMFWDATSFDQDLSNWDTSSVTNTVDMFRDATAFQAKYTCASATSGPVSSCRSGSPFQNSTELKLAVDSCLLADPTGNCDCRSSLVDCRAASGDSISKWDTRFVTNMSSLFAGSDQFNADLGAWNTSAVTSMSHMFHGAAAFNKDISGTYNANIFAWDVSGVTDMTRMFEGANSFAQDISSWNVVNVASMDSMFSGANAFNAPIGSWNTDGVTNMFQICLLYTSPSPRDRG